MPAVRISVGASSDGSMRTVFRPMVDAARAARDAIQSQFSHLDTQIAQGLKASTAAAAKSFAAMTEAERKELERQIAQVRAAEREKVKLREEAARAGAAAEERENRRGGGGGRGGPNTNPGYRTALGTVRYMDRMVRGAGAVAGDIARGVGVHMNIGELVGQHVQLTKLATDLANSGWQPNSDDAAARKRVPAEALVGEARAAGNKAALSPEKALEGMRQFVAITGDLKSARELIGDLGVMSRATGTDFEDMVSAAGEVNAKLGDIPNKGQATLGVLRALSGQGKLGAIEMRQMAVEMAKIGAASKSFNMAPDQAMQMMGVLMQEARQAGGAKSASIAANAAMALVTNMTKATNIKAMQKAGLQPWADPKTKTTLLSPETMILAALYKSKGNLQDLSTIFRDKMSMTAVRGFATVYNQAKGTPEEKLQAVRDEFSRLKKAQMGQGEVEEQFKASMATPEAKIQLFNNKLSEIGEEIAGKVLPAMEKLAPVVIKGVEAFGQLIAWAATNPGQALAAALTVSIARAGIDTVIRSGIESLFKAAGGGPSAGGGGGKLGGAMGNLGAALTIAAAAITIEQVGELLIDKVMKEKEQAEDRSRDVELHAMNTAAGARAAVERGDTKGAVAANTQITSEIAMLQQRIAAAEATKTFGYGLTHRGILGGLSNAAAYVTSGAVGSTYSADTQRDADAKHLGEMKSALERLQAAQTRTAAALTGGVLRVEVVNAGFSLVDHSGRSGGGAVPPGQHP